MDRLFLDSSVLFAAAYRARAGVRLLWTLADVELVTSSYVCGEVHQNLVDPQSPVGEQIKKLDRLAELVRRLQVIALTRPTAPSRQR